MPPKDASQLTTNLITATQVERVFKDAVATANISQHQREHALNSTSSSAIDVDDTMNNNNQNNNSLPPHQIQVNKEARVGINRAANISTLMLGALAADAKIMDPSSAFQNKFQSANLVNVDNVLTALTKAGFGHLVGPCKKAVLEDVDDSNETVLGIRRQRGQQ